MHLISTCSVWNVTIPITFGFHNGASVRRSTHPYSRGMSLRLSVPHKPRVILSSWSDHNLFFSTEDDKNNKSSCTKGQPWTQVLTGQWLWVSSSVCCPHGHCTAEVTYSERNLLTLGQGLLQLHQWSNKTASNFVSSVFKQKSDHDLDQQQNGFWYNDFRTNN